MDEQVTTKEKRVRMPIWTLRDACKLVELYERHHKCIVSAFSATITTKTKQTAWQTLHSDFIKTAPDNVREFAHVQTKIANIKDEVRRYARSLRYHETGGGPPPTEPPAYVKKMYDIVHGTTGDCLVGIGAGTESGVYYSAISTPMTAPHEPKRPRLFENIPPNTPTTSQKEEDHTPKLSVRKKNMKSPSEQQNNVLDEHRQLIKEQRYMVYLKTLKVRKELEERGIAYASFEDFSNGTESDLISPSTKLLKN